MDGDLLLRTWPGSWHQGLNDAQTSIITAEVLHLQEEAADCRYDAAAMLGRYIRGEVDQDVVRGALFDAVFADSWVLELIGWVGQPLPDPDTRWTVCIVRDHDDDLLVGCYDVLEEAIAALESDAVTLLCEDDSIDCYVAALNDPASFT